MTYNYLISKKSGRVKCEIADAARVEIGRNETKVCFI